MSDHNMKMAIEHEAGADVSRRARVARALACEGFDDVHVVDRETATQLLSEKRQELLDTIREGNVESVRGLAKDLDRDAGAVSRDLDLFFEHDVVEYDREGQRKIPRLKHGVVIAEPIA